MQQERLQKIIAHAGVSSRREAEAMIREGRVTLNGRVVTELGTRADPDRDHIKVDGKLITKAEPHRYILLYKPKEVMTTVEDPQGRRTVIELVRGIRERIYPVGRLDFHSEGLVLLTNDGANGREAPARHHHRRQTNTSLRHRAHAHHRQTRR
jgi:23S rRNA pseudouridine2605 synthase